MENTNKNTRISHTRFCIAMLLVLVLILGLALLVEMGIPQQVLLGFFESQDQQRVEDFKDFQSEHLANKSDAELVRLDGIKDILRPLAEEHILPSGVHLTEFELIYLGTDWFAHYVVIGESADGTQEVYSLKCDIIVSFAIADIISGSYLGSELLAPPQMPELVVEDEVVSFKDETPSNYIWEYYAAEAGVA